MKTNFLPRRKKWNWKFKIVSLLLYTFSLHGFGQTSEKTFVQEIEVDENITIASNVPTSLDIELNAQYSTRNNTYNGYIVVGKNNQDRLFIHKEYAIHTWRKNTIRQEVDIKIKSDSDANNKAFLNQLKIHLIENNKQILVDANMNLEKFTMRNSRFRSDNCQIILEDGTSFSIDYLEIKTRLYIPKTANLKVNSILNHTLKLDDLEGNLDLNIQYGEVYGKKIKNLNANLRFCYDVIFKEAETVNTSATNSYLKIDKVNHLSIGEEKLSKELGNQSATQVWMNNNSSMNIYDFRDVEKMIIFDTANDKFEIGEVNHLEVKSSIFSNYEILKLNETFSLNAKSGDVSISEIAASFKNINLKNTHSNLTLNIPEKGNFGINIYHVTTIDYSLPPNAKLIKSKSSKDLYFKIGEGKNTGTIDIRCNKCELDIW